MNTVIIFSSLMVILDGVLLFVIYQMYQKWRTHDTLLADITEERHLLHGLQRDIKHECEKIERKATELLDKMKQISSEIEEDIQESKKSLSKNLESVATDLLTQFEPTLKELLTRQQSLHSLYKKVDQEKDILAKMMKRAEDLMGFFNQEKNYEEVLKDIQEKKYTDARALMTKGFSADQISKQVGLPLSEVHAMSKMIVFY